MSPRALGLALTGAVIVGAIVVGVVVDGIARLDADAPGATRGLGPGVGSAGEESRFPIVAYQGADELGDERLDFTDLLGRGKPVVLNFWAAACPPCRAEMPAFQQVYDRHRSDILLVGVDIGPFIGLGNREGARGLLDELGITYPAAYAVDASAVEDYRVVGMPTTVFFAADGSEADRHVGLMTAEMFEARIRDLVGAPG